MFFYAKLVPNMNLIEKQEIGEILANVGRQKWQGSGHPSGLLPASERL
jgi:hypothetical protein